MIRLNNKGQALVLFVVLFPIIILVLISVVDVGRALYEKQSIDNTCNMVIIGTTFGFDLWEMSSSYRGKNENGKKVIERIK